MLIRLKLILKRFWIYKSFKSCLKYGSWDNTQLPFILPIIKALNKYILEVIIMTPCELTASITAIANALASKLSINELNLLGAVFSQLGDTLTTIATQRSICESNKEKDKP